MLAAKERPDETITVCPAREITAPQAPDLALGIPRHWWPDPLVNVHAARIEEETLAWFRELGFGERSIWIVRTFAPADYAGMPFPLASPRELLLLAKYLSLWLLWDDVDVEGRERTFPFCGPAVLEPSASGVTTLFGATWSALLRELATTMSPAWMATLCEAMDTWSTAALKETRTSKQRRAGLARISYEEALRSRIDTIGMAATGYLLEYARGIELPPDFHAHETALALKTLSGKIVGFGNDIWSLGKDWASGYVNVILALREEHGLTMLEAVRRIIREHDEAIAEFDRLARTLPSFGAAWDPHIATWVQDLRHASLGFTLWESRAPRYAAFKMLVNGTPIDPSFIVPTSLAPRAAAATASAYAPHP